MPTIKTYQKKADKLLQEVGRTLYDSCMICGGEYSCLHHFIKKSQSTELRYNLKNCIPICHRCHCAIHQGKNDAVTGRIVAIKGSEWLDEIEALKRQGIGKYYGVGYYKKVCEDLSQIKP